MFITILESVAGVCAVIASVAGVAFAVSQILNTVQTARKKERL